MTGGSPGDKKRILILGVLPALPQLHSFQGSGLSGTQLYIYLLPVSGAREGWALSAMHVRAQARSQLKQPGPAFPPDSPMGACGSNGLMRWDSQKCIARQRGTAGQPGPGMQAGGKPARGAARPGRNPAAGVEMQRKLSGRNQERRPSSMEHATLRDGQEPGVRTAGTEGTTPGPAPPWRPHGCPGSSYLQPRGKGPDNCYKYLGSNDNKMKGTQLLCLLGAGACVCPIL